MIKTLRKLLNLRRECHGCQILKEQLEKKNIETQMLLDTITSICKPAVIVPQNSVSQEPIRQGKVRWDVRRRILKANSRKAATIKKEHPEISEDIQKLEEELGLSDEGNPNGNDIAPEGDESTH